MKLYQIFATYTAAIGVAVALSGVPQKIDGYSVTHDEISTGDFPSATVWRDTDGDGVFDTKTHSVLAGRRGIITVDRPFEESDRKLTDDLVARLE
jgi:hypothetical protein